MAGLTLIDIAKRNGHDELAGLIEDEMKAHPEVRLTPSRTIRGTEYKTLIRLKVPATGFRKANGSHPAYLSGNDKRSLISCRVFNLPALLSLGLRNRCV